MVLKKLEHNQLETWHQTHSADPSWLQCYLEPDDSMRRLAAQYQTTPELLSNSKIIILLHMLMILLV